MKYFMKGFISIKIIILQVNYTVMHEYIEIYCLWLNISKKTIVYSGHLKFQKTGRTPP